MKIERFPVEEGHIMLFARAIGDANPVYSDPTCAAARALGGVIAPPTFVAGGSQFDLDDVAVRPKIGQPWFGSGRTASGQVREGGGLLHAEQHYEYVRPLHAGEVLFAVARDGARWEKTNRSGGLLQFEETIIEYRVQGTDELVVTSRSVVVRPPRPAAEPTKEA